MNIRRTTISAGLSLVFTVLGLSGVAFAYQVDDLPSGIAVLEKYAEACGGVEKLKALKTLKMKGRVILPGVEGTVSSIREMPGRIVSKAELPQFGSQQEGFDGKIGWETSTMLGPRILNGPELDQVTAEADMSRIYDPASFYKSVEQGGIETRNGKKCYKLLVTLKNGRSHKEFYSVDTGLMVAREKSRVTQQGEMEVLRTIKEYKVVEGVKIISRFDDKVVGGTMTITFDEIVGNAKLGDDVFALPEEIKTLVNKGAGNKDAEKSGDKTKAADTKQLVDEAVARLVELQHEDGAWPYEGVYRVRGKIPVGYRIGGTSIVCSSLLSAGLKDTSSIEPAIEKATDMILKELEHPLMEPKKVRQYDVRIWGHIYALDYFCRLHNTKGFDTLKEKTKPWLQKLVDALVLEELDKGGWNYATRRQHCCFATGPAAQALLLAKELGLNVPDEVLQRTVEIFEASRKDDSVFPYSGTRGGRDTQAGSVARAPVSEVTLALLGKGKPELIKASIDSFHKNWDELEKRRKKNGTHLPPHGIAPYYFYYGHRYAAQAIRLLPKEKQDEEFKKFVAVLMKTKDPDNTWNDRVFDQSKAYGTAMSLLALSRDNVQLPKKVELEMSATDSTE